MTTYIYREYFQGIIIEEQHTRSKEQADAWVEESVESMLALYGSEEYPCAPAIIHTTPSGSCDIYYHSKLAEDDRTYITLLRVETVR